MSRSWQEEDGESGAEAVRDREVLCASRGDQAGWLRMSGEGGKTKICVSRPPAEKQALPPAQWLGPTHWEWAVV